MKKNPTYAANSNITGTQNTRQRQHAVNMEEVTIIKKTKLKY